MKVQSGHGDHVKWEVFYPEVTWAESMTCFFPNGKSTQGIFSENLSVGVLKQFQDKVTSTS